MSLHSHFITAVHESLEKYTIQLYQQSFQMETLQERNTHAKNSLTFVIKILITWYIIANIILCFPSSK